MCKETKTTNDGAEVIYSNKTGTQIVCVNAGDVVNLIQNTINILSKPDMTNNMFNLFKDELPLICNHHSIKVVRCDEEGKIYD